MSLKLFMLVFLAFIFFGLQAQNRTDNTVTAKPDSFTTTIQTSDGKIVTIGEPIDVKPLTTMDKAELFIKAAYKKYPVWCWIAGAFLLFSILRLVSRLFKK